MGGRSSARLSPPAPHGESDDEPPGEEAGVCPPENALTDDEEPLAKGELAAGEPGEGPLLDTAAPAADF